MNSYFTIFVHILFFVCIFAGRHRPGGVRGEPTRELLLRVLGNCAGADGARIYDSAQAQSACAGSDHKDPVQPAAGLGLAHKERARFGGRI